MQGKSIQGSHISTALLSPKGVLKQQLHMYNIVYTPLKFLLQEKIFPNIKI